MDLLVASLSLIMLAALAFVGARRWWGQPLQRGWTVIKLRPMETQLVVQMLPAICTLSAYEGAADNACVELLRSRVANVVSQNPWLAGRLVRQRGHIVLAQPPPSDLPSCFEVHEDALADLTHAPYEEISARLRPFRVRRGLACIDADDEPLFRVALVRDFRASKSLVVVSLSHIIGDGHTFYALHAMLNGEARPLDPVRPTHFDAGSDAAFGMTKNAYLFSLPALLGFVGNMFFKPAFRVRVVTVDDEWVAAQKAGHAAARAAKGGGGDGDVAWVSTNDVLTSWALTAGGYAYGAMAINCRGRLPETHEDLAGNYENVVQYWPEDFHTPAGVRLSLLSPPRFMSVRTEVPSLADSLRSNMATVTNWATFYTPLALPTCTLCLHLPMAMDEYPTAGHFVVFAHGVSKDGLAVILAERRDAVARREAAADGPRLRDLLMHR
jgi:hypothetical protein